MSQAVERKIENFAGTDDAGKYVGHHDGAKEVLVSQGSRELARPAQLKFASHEQERDFWIKESSAVERAIMDLNSSFAGNLAAASRNAKGGKDWQGRKSAIESTHADNKKQLVQRKQQIEVRLRELRLLIHQENQRVAHQNAAAKTNRVSAAAEWCPEATRADGSVDYGVLLFRTIAELREMRGLLARMCELMEKK